MDAFARWPGMIEEDSIVGDMVHCVDLYTTFARIAGATRHIPRKRLVDGVDQTSLMLLGEQHGRRDHVFIYQGPVPRALVKEQYKLHIPGPGENLIVANFYDLFRDPREEKPVSTQIGAWAAESFKSIIKRHMAMKQHYPDTPPAFGRPYDGVENLRPETRAAVEAFLAGQPQRPD